MKKKQINGTEIMEAINLIVSSKGISRDSVVEIVKDSIVESLKEKYGDNENLMVSIDNQSGEINAYREMIVTDSESEDQNLFINIIQARRIEQDCNIGDKIVQILPDISGERKVANTIKNSIFGRIKSIEKQIEFEEFKKREGEIVTGFVKRATRFGCIVSIGSNAEGIIFREGMIFGETFNEKEKVNACISEVRRSDSDFQIILSRTSDNFLFGLLKDSVPEISTGLVEVKGIARNPGSRAKVAVWSSDVRIDAVGSCIGARGSRISQVVDELKGEKVDIIAWDRDILTFGRNAIVPAKPIKIELSKDENEKDIIEIFVRKEDLSLAIGKRGQNVRLASKILGMDLNITSEEERREKLMNRLQKITSELKSALDIDEIVAQLLISEGFISIDKISESSPDQLAQIQGFNEKIASELHVRAVDWKNKLKEDYEKRAKEVNFDNRILDLPFLTEKEYMMLIDKNILTLVDIADLSCDELGEVLSESTLDKGQINKITAQAKEHIYS